MNSSSINSAGTGATYEDYEREYQNCLGQVRSYLAGPRSTVTLNECNRLLYEARNHATAMQGMAEINNNAIQIQYSRQLLERDIAPLQNEIQRTITNLNRDTLFSTTTANQSQQQQQYAGGYRPPGSSDIELGGASSNPNEMMQSLIQSSDDLLRESQAILAETEYIGTNTLLQMGRQREQIQSSSLNVERIQYLAQNAGIVLKSMSRRALKNRICLYLMIFTLGSANIFVLYLMYKKHHRAANKGQS